MYTVGIVGFGYVGLTLGVHLAARGCKVVGIETADSVVESVSNGRAHFFEEGFDKELSKLVSEGRLEVSPDYKKLADCDVVFLTLGTPLGPDGSVNLVPLSEAAKLVAEEIAPRTLVILRSTVKIGTTRQVIVPLFSPGSEILVAYCPERTLEGKALEELSCLPQLVSGANTASLQAASDFFKQLGNQVIELPLLEEAELAKLINNTERDLMFAFANEIALACQTSNLDANRVIRSANLNYPRSNLKIPGPVGGPCLEKDPHILHESFPNLGEVSLFNISRRVNQFAPSQALKQAIESRFSRNGRTISRVAVLGFAFKGNPPTSDTRGSLAFDIVDFISQGYPGVQIYGHDYLAELENIGSVFSKRSVEEAVAGADLVIIQNNHPNYQLEDWLSISAQMGKDSLLFDFWNQLSQYKFSPSVRYQVFGGPDFG